MATREPPSEPPEILSNKTDQRKPPAEVAADNRFVETETLRKAAQTERRSAERARNMVVIHNDHVRHVQLPLGNEILIGRSRQAGLLLDDPTVSREHARLYIAGSTVEIAHAGGRNGTLVNGTPLAGRRALRAGDEVTIGDFTLFLQRPMEPSEALPIFDSGSIQVCVQAEAERAARYQGPFSVMCVQFLAENADTRSAIEWLRGVIGVPCSLGLLDAAQVICLLPELSPEEALTTATRLLEAQLPDGHVPRIGIAHWPSDGCDSDSLIDAARHAAAEASPGHLRCAADTVVLRKLGGERFALVADPVMLRLYGMVEKLASKNIAVLVVGESGTGKELVARALHHLSPRRDGPFVAVNCAAFPTSLFEGELFGYVAGAFTDAKRNKVGLLAAANGGTIFLDEIGEMDVHLQAKLLRVLEEKSVRPLGDVKETALDVRIISATNRPLEKAIEEKTFRRDLYYRICVHELSVPPLRERPRELPILASSFLRELCSAAGEPFMTLSPASLVALSSYSWPGNVRELSNAIASAAACANGESTIEVSHLPERIRRMAVGRSLATSLREPATRKRPRVAPAHPNPSKAFVTDESLSLADEVMALERQLITDALLAVQGNRTHAAKRLGISVKTVRAKIRQYGIEIAEDGEPHAHGDGDHDN